MPIFSERSLSILETCHIDIVRIMMDVIPHFDCSIISGYRGEDDQNELFRQGLSQKKFPNSCHNISPLSVAVDIAPYPIDWMDLEQFTYLAGFVKGIAIQRGIQLRWGGDWNNNYQVSDEHFRDFGHFELIEV